MLCCRELLEAFMRGHKGEGVGAPSHGQETNEMVVIYVMLQGSRMKLVCVCEEEKVVGLHLMVKR